MKKLNKSDLTAIDGSRHKLERELIQSLFTEHHHAASEKQSLLLKKLQRKGKLTLVAKDKLTSG